MNIAIRVDASSQIGIGHLMRCLTLANDVHEQGSNVHFICRDLTTDLAALVGHACHTIHHLPSRRQNFSNDSGLFHGEWLGASLKEDADQTKVLLSSIKPEWLLVDHYGIDYRWERLQRAHARNILVIDDIADRKHDCDVLLDQNYYKNLQTRYENLLPEKCKKLLGPRYSLLRNEFANLRENLQPRKGFVKHVVIAFGGSDQKNLTAKAVAAASAIGEPLELDVIVGATYPFYDELKAQCAPLSNVRVHIQTNQVATILATADLAIGASGTTNWERCCTGVPALLFCIAHNQRQLLEDLSEDGYVYGVTRDVEVTEEKIKAILETALLSPAMLRGMSERSFALVDGKGSRRVSALMMRNRVSLRLATPSDATTTWNWRNAESTRKFFFNSSPITLEDHVEWWNRTVCESNTSLLIAKIGNIDIGVLRFDHTEAQSIVSIYLDPSMTGLGLAVNILKEGKDWIKKNRSETSTLLAKILPENRPSISAFSASGFSKQGENFQCDL